MPERVRKGVYHCGGKEGEIRGKRVPVRDFGARMASERPRIKNVNGYG